MKHKSWYRNIFIILCNCMYPLINKKNYHITKLGLKVFPKWAQIIRSIDSSYRPFIGIPLEFGQMRLVKVPSGWIFYVGALEEFYFWLLMYFLFYGIRSYIHTQIRVCNTHSLHMWVCVLGDHIKGTSKHIPVIILSTTKSHQREGGHLSL